MSRGKASSGACRETAGIAELRADNFSDVKRALHLHLMRTDEIYRRASARSSEVNRRRLDRGNGIEHDDLTPEQIA